MREEFFGKYPENPLREGLFPPSPEISAIRCHGATRLTSFVFFHNPDKSRWDRWSSPNGFRQNTHRISGTRRGNSSRRVFLPCNNDISRRRNASFHILSSVFAQSSTQFPFHAGEKSFFRERRRHFPDVPGMLKGCRNRDRFFLHHASFYRCKTP